MVLTYDGPVGGAGGMCICLGAGDICPRTRASKRPRGTGRIGNALLSEAASAKKVTIESSGGRSGRFGAATGFGSTAVLDSARAPEAEAATES